MPRFQRRIMATSMSDAPHLSAVVIQKQGRKCHRPITACNCEAWATDAVNHAASKSGAQCSQEGAGATQKEQISKPKYKQNGQINRQTIWYMDTEAPDTLSNRFWDRL